MAESLPRHSFAFFALCADPGIATRGGCCGNWRFARRLCRRDPADMQASRAAPCGDRWTGGVRCGEFSDTHPSRRSTCAYRPVGSSQIAEPTQSTASAVCLSESPDSRQDGLPAREPGGGESVLPPAVPALRARRFDHYEQQELYSIGGRSSTTRSWLRRSSTSCSNMPRRSTSRARATGSRRSGWRGSWGGHPRRRVRPSRPGEPIRGGRPSQARLEIDGRGTS